MTDSQPETAQVTNAHEANTLARDIEAKVSSLKTWLKSVASDQEVTSRSRYRAKAGLETCREMSDALEDLTDALRGIERDPG